MNIEEAERICICRMCPSYFDCGEKLAFCLWESGVSKCIKTESGCICPGCPVLQQLGLLHEYYCTRGSEKNLNAPKKEV